jgi:hypothetical protein
MRLVILFRRISKRTYASTDEPQLNNLMREDTDVLARLHYAICLYG